MWRVATERLRLRERGSVLNAEVKQGEVFLLLNSQENDDGGKLFIPRLGTIYYASLYTGFGVKTASASCNIFP